MKVSRILLKTVNRKAAICVKKDQETVVEKLGIVGPQNPTIFPSEYLKIVEYILRRKTNTMILFRVA